MNRWIDSRSLVRGGCRAALLVALALAPCRLPAAVTVQVNGPGGFISQTLPDAGGQFDVNLPLNANAVNQFTVSATDAFSNRVEQVVRVTQLSLQSLVVAEVKVEPLPPQRIEELVNEGVIDLADPENFNVSIFDIVLTIGGERVPISVPIVSPIGPSETGYEIIPMPNDPGGGGSNPKPQDVEIIVFEKTVPAGPGLPSPRIYGVIVIEGRIKTLKEFYSARLLLMNTSGIFTLKDVTAQLTFPDGGLSHTLPADGLVSFGDILPGDGGTPGQKEREFILRGDEIGVRRIHLDFGGTIGGPGLPDDPPIAFSGGAGTTVEVKGPPQFLVQVFHPPVVISTNLPYDLIVEIQNTGELPALYASLDLEVGADGLLEKCDVVTNGGTTSVECEFGHEPVTRTFGHIYPGESVRETFRVKALRDGPITSCLGVSDQNIQLQVTVGNIGCLTGHFPPTTDVPDGLPTVAVVPLPNQLGVSPTVAITAFFSELMNEDSITLGEGGTFRVFAPDGTIVNGGLRFIVIGERTVAIWQRDAGMNILDENTQYGIALTDGILDLSGNPLFNPWTSTFRTTGLLDDQDPPELTLTILPPVDPNAVLPGQTVVVNAYPSDQGSGVQRVELRLKDLNGTNALYTFIDQKTIFDPIANVTEPMLFTIDTAGLVPGHSYQLLGTAIDVMGNVRDATIAMILATTADPPVIVLPADPTNVVLQGITAELTPLSVSGGVTHVTYYLDNDAAPFSTVFMPPWQTFVRTRELPLGVHTVRVEAVDGLLQTGADTWQFLLAFNPNGPQVDFGSAVDGATFTTGSVLNVNANISDPVGVAGVEFHLDVTTNPPIRRGSEPFAFDTRGLVPGAHKIIAVASNVLGQLNNTFDPASRWDFELTVPPPGVPPPAPTVTLVGEPQNGFAVVAGTSVANARIDVVNTTLGLTLSLDADGSGNFTGAIDASGGETLNVFAYDLTQSPDPSPATVRVVPIPPTFTGITLAPPNLLFASAGQFADITVTAAIQGGGNSNVTSRASYSSSAPGIASVSASGRVVAHTYGLADITVAFQDFTNTCPVNANILTLTGIVVNPPSVVLVFTGQTETIQVIGQYNNGSTAPLTSGVIFGNSDATRIGVSAAGVVTAKADGDAQVYVSAGGLPPLAVPVSVISGLNPPPVVSILSPAEGAAAEAGGSVSVVVQANDPTGGVTRMTFAASGAVVAAETRQFSPPLGSVTRTFILPVPAQTPLGSVITLQAGAEDVAGLDAPMAVAHLGVVDTTLPTAALLSPTNGTLANAGSTVTVTVAASDIAGLGEVGYRTSGALTLEDGRSLPPGVTATNVTLAFVVPPGAPTPELLVQAVVRDRAGNERTSAPITMMLTDSDITPPSTIVTALTPPGVGTTSLVSIAILDGAEDLDHVELYFRRNGIGTFNRFTTGSNVVGHFTASGTNAWVLFDSTQMGGDGAYEFYSIGEDTHGNRESAPTNGADVAASFAAGTVWVTIGTTNIASGDLSLENANVRISNAVVTIEGAHSFHNVELLGTSVLTHAAATLTEEPGFVLNAWTLSVASNSAINVNARGYLGGIRNGNSGAGNTTNNADGAVPRSAGSHGGAGGVQDGAGSNPLYGNLLAPTDLGAGGSSDGGGQPGGNGGGRIRISAVNVAADGSMTANGEDALGFNRAGSGAGGSIYLTVRTLSGLGVLQADGGAREVGGGGGRIAVHAFDFSTKDITLIRALGGAGSFQQGGNGTVFLRDLSGGDGTLVIDGQGVGSPFTGLPIPPGVIFDSIVLRNNARAVVDDPIVVNDRLDVLTGSILTHAQGNASGLVVRAKHVLVDETSAIDVSAKGYAGGIQSGNGLSTGQTLNGQPGVTPRAAGSYGGFGGKQDGSGQVLVYGTPYAPDYLGAGGSSDGGGQPGGNGGGRVTITATGSVTIHGALRAGGQNALGFNRAGDGAGGSVRIDTVLFQGRGTVTADGGAREVGGGGGRIAVTYDYLGSGTNRFQDLRAITAAGGKATYVHGSAGTVLLRQRNQAWGDLVVDDVVTNATAGNWTPLTPLGPGTVAALTADTLTPDGGLALLPGGLVGVRVRPNRNVAVDFTVIANTATTLTVDVSGGTNLTDVATIGDRYAARYTFDNVYVRRGGYMVGADDLIVGGEMRIEENGLLTHYNTTTNYEPELRLEVGALTVSSNSAIDVSARGYLGGLRGGNGHAGRTAGNVPGAVPQSAGSHGGLGGVISGAGANPVYDDPGEPALMGAGGASDSGGQPGGNGGGRVRIVAGAIDVRGRIAANGENALGFNRAGDGAGGAILLEAGVIGGSGLITANGGAREVGGGGGRIALRYTTLTLPAANVRAYGGAGSFIVGGNGTLVFKSAAQTYGQLVVDGGGLTTPADSTPWPGGFTFDGIVLRNRARVVATAPLQAAQEVRLLAESRMSHPLEYEAGVTVEAPLLEIDATSAIDVSAKGYLGGIRGTNGHAGRTVGNTVGAATRSAGSHGGLGGINNGPGNNPVYDSVTNPAVLGSGGSSDGGGQPGGNGGGRVTVTVNSLVLNGSILADGEPALGFNRAGDGAGGAVRLNVGGASGAGLVTANGGAREVGGGGGRIAVTYNVLAMAEQQFRALGGQGGFIKGGNGTVLLQDRAQARPDLIVDGFNFITPSDSTPLPTGTVFRTLTLRNGARAAAVEPVRVHGMFALRNDSVLTHAQGFEAGLRVEAGTLLVDTNSLIDVTARGYSGGIQSGNGLSAGLTLGGTTGAMARSAGSYGGPGAVWDGPGSNPLYGSATNPAELGSGGSSDGGGQPGGNGGGRIAVIATNVVVDGAIRADGQDALGFNRAGSGSGGAVLVHAHTVSGIGTIEADGGAREIGGGGGRIAIYYEVRTLATNRVTAAGGAGAFVSGVAGTLHWELQPFAMALDGDDRRQGEAFARIVRLNATPFGAIEIEWDGTGSTWVLEGCTSLTAGDWRPLSGTLSTRAWSATPAALDGIRFLRVRQP